MVIEITDFSDPALDVYARLTEAQLMNRFDPKNALFISNCLRLLRQDVSLRALPSVKITPRLKLPIMASVSAMPASRLRTRS